MQPCKQKMVAATTRADLLPKRALFIRTLRSHAAKDRATGRTCAKLLDNAGGQPAFTRFTAREFVLYESHLGAGGAKYEIRQRFPLIEA